LRVYDDPPRAGSRREFDPAPDRADRRQRDKSGLTNLKTVISQFVRKGVEISAPSPSISVNEAASRGGCATKPTDIAKTLKIGRAAQADIPAPWRRNTAIDRPAGHTES
jgi:hypothetical protein